MYRIAILISVFLISVSGMLFLQGGNTRNPAELTGRHITDLSLENVAALAAPAIQPSPSAPSTGELALAAAVAAGRAIAPSALRTSEGRVDTAILLSELVRSATGQDPGGAPTGAIGGAGDEVRTVQDSGETRQYHFYTVQTGDSLGSIARRFYGDAELYRKIFDANRRFLASPDQIRSGQRLTIPALPSA